MQWYWQAFRQYADFNGRANRPEYWIYTLWNAIIGLALEILDAMLFHHADWPFAGLYGLAVLIPGLALQFRRLHDTGHSGWALLWLLLPLIGWIIIIVFMLQPGVRQINAYGGERYDWKPSGLS